MHVILEYIVIAKKLQEFSPSDPWLLYEILYHRDE